MPEAVAVKPASLSFHANYISVTKNTLKGVWAALLMSLLLLSFRHNLNFATINHIVAKYYNALPVAALKVTSVFIACCLLCLQLQGKLNPFYLFKLDKINTGVKPFNQNILCMAQDSIGFMWFGTSNGLYRYDGNNFEPFEFADLNGIEIRSLLVDSKNNIWIATTWEQLFKYDMYNHKLTHYIFDTISLGTNKGEVFTICEGKANTLWLASAEGLLSIDTETGRFAYITRKETNAVCLHNDTLWAGMATGGIKCFSASTYHAFTTPAQWQFLARDNYAVTCLYAGRHNYMWVGTSFGLFVQDELRQIKKLRKTTNVERGLPDNFIHTVIDEKDDGYTWVSTPKGMALYDHANNRFVSVQNTTDVNAISVVEKPVNCLFRDAAGKIWAGTEGLGIYSFNPRKVTVYRHSKTDPASIHSNELKRVFIFNNNLLATVYSDGIDLIDLISNACKFYPFYNTLNPAFSVIKYPSEKDNRSIFVGSQLGLFIFDVYTHAYTAALPAKYNNHLVSVQAAKYDNSNNLWVGCEQGDGGLYTYNANAGNWRQFREGTKGLLNTNINLLAVNGEGDMIVCNYASVQKYNNKLDSFIALTQGKQIFYSSAGVCFQSERNGNCLAGTYQDGIFLADKNLDVYNVINEAKGLSSNTVLSFLQDGSDTVWASTSWGVDRIMFADNKKDKFTITHLDNTDGLPGETVINMVVRSLGSNGEKAYYMATTEGLVELKTPATKPNAYKPPVVITSLTVDDTVIAVSDSSHLLSRPIYLTKKVNLSYMQNSLQVTFAALNYINTQKNKYAYMLQGVDKGWIYTEQPNSANYSNLPPGTYTFLVKGSNDAGVWNDQPASIQFVIKPPFWRTIWAYFLYVIIFAALVYGVYINRIKQFRAKQEAQLRTMIATQEQERKRISRDLHDDVGTKLSALKLFVSTFKNNLQKQNYAQTEMLAQNTEELIDETIRDVRVMLMNLSPGILEEFGYIVAVEGLVNKLNETKTMHIDLVIFGVEQRFGKDYELALYRITQELVNNIIKHAEAKNVSLQIGHRDNKIILMIEDDGQGFEVTAHKEGYGLKNLDARTKLLQGTMNIDSSPGNGTSVLIEIPYQFN